MSGDPEQEYFADGITEDLITDLSKLSGLFVVGRNSSFVYKARAVNLQEIARDLGVRHILEGSVRKAGQRVRITGQLIDGTTGGHVWAERFDRDLSDIFALQDEITQTIVSRLQVELLETELTEGASTTSADAYSSYLRGRQLHYQLARDDLERARAAFLEALNYDPNYARAYVGLALTETRINDWLGGKYPAQDIMNMAQRALTLAPELAEAHVANALALQSLNMTREADAAYRNALTIDPLSYDAHYNYARFLWPLREDATSAYHFLRALEIDPNDFRSPLLLVTQYERLGQTEACERYLRLGLKRAESAAERNPGNPDPIELGAATLAQMGYKEEAVKWLDRALEMDPHGEVTLGGNIACTYAQIGDLETALDWLERFAKEQGEMHRAWMRTDPSLEPLHGLPRFERLLSETPNERT